MSRSTKIGSLKALKQELSQCIDGIQDYLDAEGLPEPSLDRSAPLAFDLPEKLEDTRERALEAVGEIGALLRGPLPHLLHIVDNELFLHGALYSVGRFSIARKLGEHEEVDFSELARRCGIEATDYFIRVMRTVIAYRIFEESRPGIVRHNALSLSLLRQPELNSFIWHAYEDMIPAQLKVPDALEKWSSGENPKETAFALAQGREASTFEIIFENPARAQRFADSMVVLQSSPSRALNHMVDNFDWRDSEGKPQVVVDIGGSQGSLCAELLRTNPNASAIVQDLPGVVSNAVVPKDLEGRLQFQAQDFFQPQTTKADIYILRWILHDWPDTLATSILQNLVPALQPGARVVICETCLPKPGTVPKLTDQRLRRYDLGMRVTFNGKERDETEWRGLLARADPRFVLESVRTPKGSQLSIIEVAWTGT